MNENAHAPGFYQAYPQVTWDLAEERWLADHGRSDVLIACCRSCDWCSAPEQVAAIPERQRIAEFIAAAQHWYQCPENDPAMEFVWLGAAGVGALDEKLLIRSLAKGFRGFAESRIRPSGAAVRERWKQRPFATWDEVCQTVEAAEQLARWDDLCTAIEMALSPEVRAEN